MQQVKITKQGTTSNGDIRAIPVYRMRAHGTVIAAFYTKKYRIDMS